jgi:hypothetical protein
MQMQFYAGVEDAALFKSTDGGRSWHELPGLRTAKGDLWQPGAGGMCLQTSLLDSKPDRAVNGKWYRFPSGSLTTSIRAPTKHRFGVSTAMENPSLLFTTNGLNRSALKSFSRSFLTKKNMRCRKLNRNSDLQRR